MLAGCRTGSTFGSLPRERTALQTPRRLAPFAALGWLLFACPGVSLGQTCPGAETRVAAAEMVTIRAVGDVVLGSDWPVSNYPPGFEADAAARLRQALGSADVAFGNFEGALTTSATSTKIPRAGSVFAFRMPPRFAALLRSAGFSVLGIANNHTFDFGATGYADTLAHLADAGILPIGEPDKIAVQKVNGLTLAWIGFSHLTRDNYVGDLDKLALLVGKARPSADLVIVSMQAGAEGSDALRVRNADEIFLGEHRGNTFAFARKAIDLGADLVLGHGPHVLRGMECYGGKLIAYSLGNFAGYDALSIKRAASVSASLEVTLARDRQLLRFRVVPLRFTADRLPESDPDELALHLINDLSRLAPLNGTVHLPVADPASGAYQRWLEENGLRKQLEK